MKITEVTKADVQHAQNLMKILGKAKPVLEDGVELLVAADAMKWFNKNVADQIEAASKASKVSLPPADTVVDDPKPADFEPPKSEDSPPPARAAPSRKLIRKTKAASK